MTGSTALEPHLTPLDERVMAAVRADGRRVADIAADVHRRTGAGKWIGGRAQPSAEQVAEVRGILRGLEHLGQVTGRGGWWRRCRAS